MWLSVLIFSRTVAQSSLVRTKSERHQDLLDGIRFKVMQDDNGFGRTIANLENAFPEFLQRYALVVDAILRVRRYLDAVRITIVTLTKNRRGVMRRGRRKIVQGNFIGPGNCLKVCRSRQGQAQQDESYCFSDMHGYFLNSEDRAQRMTKATGTPDQQRKKSAYASLLRHDP